MQDLTPSAARRAGRPACLTLLLSLALMQAAQAQWVWRDKDGRVNASDRPPPAEVPAKDIVSRPAAELRRQAAAPAASAAASSVPGLPGTAAVTAAVGSASAPRGPLEREVDARKRAAEQEQAAKAKADEERAAQQRAENCRRARGHVAALESGQRISRTNERGEREVLDDRGRADELRQARGVIASDCR